MEENQTEENEVLAETPFQENVETVVQEEQTVLTKKQLRLEKKLQRKAPKALSGIKELHLEVSMAKLRKRIGMAKGFAE